MNKIFGVVLILLLCIALIESVYLVKTRIIDSSNIAPKQDIQIPKKQQATDIETKGVGPEAPKSLLLQTPDASASSEQKLIYDKFLKTNARDSGIIFVNKDCDISPTITRIKKRSEFKLINEDEETHIVKIGEADDITLDAEKIETIEEDYPLGSVPIFCNQKLSGYIYVEL